MRHSEVDILLASVSHSISWECHAEIKRQHRDRHSRSSRTGCCSGAPCECLRLAQVSAANCLKRIAHSMSHGPAEIP